MGNAQSRREEREARRKKNQRTWGAIGGAGIVLLSGGILAYNLSTGNQPATDPQAIPSSCTSVQRVTVETTEAMSKALKGIPVSEEDCIALVIDHSSTTLETAEQIINGKSAPNLWIPDSSTRAELALAGKAQVVTKSDSLAKTPAVIVSNNNPEEKTWNSALSDAQKIHMSEPKEDSAAFMALINAAAETDSNNADKKDLTTNVGMRAQTIGVDQPIESASDLITDVADNSAPAAIVTEADFYRYKKEHPDSPVKVFVPGDSTNMLNYPMYQPSSGSDANRTINLAADKIKNYLSSDEGKKALQEQGLRDSEADPLNDHSVGTVSPLTIDNSKLISSMWGSYLRQSAPLHALVAIDNSESMNWKLGDTDRTRMSVTKESVVAGTQLFPSRDSIGLWSFAHDIGTDEQGNPTDYKELVPIRGMNEEVDGVEQRDLLAQASQEMQPHPGLSTDLNDTTLAAFKHIKANYQSGSSNVAVIMTDGENTGDSSISTEELIKTIQEEQNENAPVFFLFIGLSEDADMTVLTNLATQIGGEAFSAKSAEDIQKIFQEALSTTDDPSLQEDSSQEEISATEDPSLQEDSSQEEISDAFASEITG